MMLHEKGRKAERDRAVLLASYEAMCREFRVPRAKRLTTDQIARMTTVQLYRASKDLYNGTSIKKAARLAVKMGLVEHPKSWAERMWRKVTDPHPERSELHAKTRYEEAARA